MNKSSSQFVKNLKALIEKSALSAAETARRAQMTPQQFNSYLNEGRAPSFDVIDRIASVFGVPPSRLFQSDEIGQIEPPHTVEDCIRVAIGARGNLPPGIMLIPFWKLPEAENGFITSLASALTEIPPKEHNEILGLWQEIAENRNFREVVSIIFHLDEPTKRGLIEHIRSIGRGAAIAHAATVARNKKKA
jgi:transcriptional regulator with XRE-family HTH domain